MTRATLLHVLERPTALGPTEVRELEQLAQAFPYCQTAHLLLAKAAHDQGTMLAGQRLRRAATYAADRTLLRRLIEQQESATAPAPAVLPATQHPLDLVDWPDEYVPPTTAPLAAPLPVATAPPVPTQVLPPVVPPIAPSLTDVDSLVAAVDIIALAVAAAPLSQTVALPEPTLASIAVPSLTPGTPPESAVSAQLPVTAAVEPVVELLDLPVATPVIITPALTTAAEAPENAASAAPKISNPLAAALETPVIVDVELVTAASAEVTLIVAAAVPVFKPMAEKPSVVSSMPDTTAAEVLPVPAAELPEAELPAQAPAIRPPGEAQFEFGLADPAPVVVVPLYELPGLIDEWAASAVTRSLGSPEAIAPTRPAPIVPVFTPAAFTGDAMVGYSYGESSRLGLSMQLLDLLIVKAETDESTTAVSAAAQPPAGLLPPTGTFFEPDLLLLDHWATHRPATPELPTTLDLINNFLKRQPRLTRPAMLPLSATHQADLSVRSTRAEPDLVSENLARIFVRQGKPARAIEIYEKLMVKQPEKMAYFALQIKSLQPSV